MWESQQYANNKPDVTHIGDGFMDLMAHILGGNSQNKWATINLY